MRHIWRWLGFTAVTKKNFISSLECGYSVIFVPGGVHETVFLEAGCEVHVGSLSLNVVRSDML